MFSPYEDEGSFQAHDADIDREREAAFQDECDRDEFLASERHYSPPLEESDIEEALRRPASFEFNLAVDLAKIRKEVA